jgi:hypothetical protein
VTPTTVQARARSSTKRSRPRPANLYQHQHRGPITRGRAVTAKRLALAVWRPRPLLRGPACRWTPAHSRPSTVLVFAHGRKRFRTVGRRSRRFPHSSARMSALLSTPAGYTGRPRFPRNPRLLTLTTRRQRSSSNESRARGSRHGVSRCRIPPGAEACRPGHGAVVGAECSWMGKSAPRPDGLCRGRVWWLTVEDGGDAPPEPMISAQRDHALQPRRRSRGPSRPQCCPGRELQV